jgi:hypothetical protein
MHVFYLLFMPLVLFIFGKVVSQISMLCDGICKQMFHSKGFSHWTLLLHVSNSRIWTTETGKTAKFTIGLNLNMTRFFAKKQLPFSFLCLACLHISLLHCCSFTCFSEIQFLFQTTNLSKQTQNFSVLQTTKLYNKTRPPSAITTCVQVLEYTTCTVSRI